jgi:hypothetical protein
LKVGRWLFSAGGFSALAFQRWLLNAGVSTLAFQRLLSAGVFVEFPVGKGLT